MENTSIIGDLMDYNANNTLPMESIADTVVPMESTANIALPTEFAEKLIHSYGERIFVAICWLLIATFGSVGNSMVIVAVILSRKLRTVTNVFVVSLALADLLTSLFLTWSVVALLGPNGWPLPNAEWLCVAGGFMIFTCTGTSLYNLAVIALNRLLLITLPFETYRKIYQKMNVAIMVAIVWFTPASVCIALPFAGIGGFGYDQQHSTCSDLDQHPKGETFHLAQTVTFYPIPLITIIVCYGLVFRHIKRHFMQQRENLELTTTRQPTTSETGVSSSGVSSGSASGRSSTRNVESAVENKQSSRTQRINQVEMEITKNLFLVVCVFFLFFTPYFVALFIPGSDYFLLYGGIIVLANSCMNPVIYARRHPHFKRVFLCMIRRRYRDIPEPSTFLKRFLWWSGSFRQHVIHNLTRFYDYAFRSCKSYFQCGTEDIFKSTDRFCFILSNIIKLP